MPSALPAGESVPDDGALPASARARLGSRPFGVYVHVPFCATRCGYCDFNTYVPAELAGSVSPETYAETAIAELRLARRLLGAVDLPVRTVFFGGGTPTLLPATDLGAVLAAIAGEFGLAADAEVTAEANPESVDPAYLDALRAAGVNRLSVGMQSATPAVLAVLDRRHTPGRAVAAVAEARAAGFASVSLDLIYGTPGESRSDWQHTLDAALAASPDHVSAYSLTVEEGTGLARRVARGELAAPQDDVLAERYEQADEALTAAGLGWYEISNWSRPGHRCRHNLGYWRGDDWWGIGPGAHSAIGDSRWWNRKSPVAYRDRLLSGLSPAAAREVLDPGQRRLEKVLLGIRLADGLPTAGLPPAAVAELREDGLVLPDPRSASCSATRSYAGTGTPAGGRLVLTRRGRLLADTVVTRLLR